MPAIRLTFACGLYDRMLALYTGEVRPEGIDLDFRVIDSPRELFDRVAATAEFDVCEMSSSEFISRMSAGQNRFVAIPVFPSRAFRHGFIAVNRASGIRSPKDLEGKRVGVPLYTMTAAIWIRGHLQHEYGVDLSTIRWVQGSTNSPGRHGEPTVMPLVRNVPIEINASGKSMSDLIDAGAVDATIGTSLPAAMRHNPHIERLFPDFRAVEKAFYARTRIFPIMHVLAIRRDVYEKHPFVAASLYQAFCDSKKTALEKMRYLAALRYMLPWMPDDLDEIDRVFGGDPWPYGIEANRPTLEALVTYLVEQSIIAAPIPVEELFVPVEGD
ncbi:MAG: ABC transporter substrate-binding protein [Betaproteobacteria bacterium]|nr:ABC transporter substrate-binding protein [Betaproteobacteria bacterium]